MRIVLVLSFFLFILPLPSAAQEVVVLPGYDEAIEWLETINWWGEELRGEQLQVPRTLLIGISTNWRKQAPQMLSLIHI